MPDLCTQLQSPPPALSTPPAPIPLLVYTAEQVCAALQISKVTLWRLERRGLLRPIASLRHKRYSAAAVRDFLAGRAGS